jgi:hypothetical protein
VARDGRFGNHRLEPDTAGLRKPQAVEQGPSVFAGGAEEPRLDRTIRFRGSLLHVIGWPKIEKEFRIVFGSGQVYFTGREYGHRSYTACRR